MTRKQKVVQCVVFTVVFLVTFGALISWFADGYAKTQEGLARTQSTVAVVTLFDATGQETVVAYKFSYNDKSYEKVVTCDFCPVMYRMSDSPTVYLEVWFDPTNPSNSSWHNKAGNSTLFVFIHSIGAGLIIGVYVTLIKATLAQEAPHSYSFRVGHYSVFVLVTEREITVYDIQQDYEVEAPLPLQFLGLKEDPAITRVYSTALAEMLTDQEIKTLDTRLMGLKLGK